MKIQIKTKLIQGANGVDCAKVLFACLPIVFMSVVSYGWRPVLNVMFSMVVCTVLDRITFVMRGQKYDSGDISPCVTGAILALLLPAVVPLWLIFVGDAVAILLAKAPFGGYGNNIFNPACVGLAFLSMMWSNQVYNYSTPFIKLPLVGDGGQSLISSPMSTLKMGGVPYLSITDIIEGNFAGPLAACGFAVVLACGAYLIVCKVINWRLPASFLGAVCLFSFFIPRVSATRIESMLLELLCSPLLFCAFFVVADPVTAPKRQLSQYIYGALFGIVTMLFAYYGAYEFGVPFAAIALNALSSFIDRRVTQWEGRYSISRQIEESV